jgi:hypothetical protein
MSNESVSGQFAAVDGVPGLMNWSVTRAKPSNAQKHSGTRGGTQRRRGVGSWTGAISGVGGLPPGLPGTPLAFLGYTGPGNNTEGGTGIRYSGTIYITDVTIKWDYTTNAIVGYDLNFVGHLGLTRSEGAAVVDSVSTIEVESSLCPLKYDAVLAGDYVPFSDVTTAQLKISSEVSSFVNSSTGNETGRRSSSLVDWEFSATIERTDNTLAEGTEITLQLHTTAALFWELKYGLVREYAGISADRTSGAIMSQTLVIEMSSNKQADGSLGFIKVPGGTQYWPTL